MKIKNNAKKFFKIFLFPLTSLAMMFVCFYKYCISPLLPHACRFTPTCSSYALVAFKEYGFLKGGVMAFNRLFRCNPWSKGGYDPVKPNIKGNIKWIL